MKNQSIERCWDCKYFGETVSASSFCHFNGERTLLLNGQEIPDWCPLKDIIEVDEVLYTYNSDPLEYKDASGDSLKYGCYSVEEFIHWLKDNNYKFIK